MMQQKRRRVFAVTSSLQYRFLSLAIVYSFIIIFYFVIAINFTDIYQMQDKSLSLEMQGLAAKRVIAHHSWIWPAAILLTIGLGLHSFIEFKKITGPLYRFRWAFKQLENGSLLSAIKLREKDHLIEEEKAYNGMLIALNGKLNTIKLETSEALKSIVELEKAIEQGSGLGETQMEMLRIHRMNLDRLSDAVQFFRLHNEEKSTTAAIQQTT